MNITLPNDAIALAEIIASLIRSDRRRGIAADLAPSAIIRESDGDLDPRQVAAQGGGSSVAMVRAMGGFHGTHIGVARESNGNLRPMVFWMDRQGIKSVQDPAGNRGALLVDPMSAAIVPIWIGIDGPVSHTDLIKEPVPGPVPGGIASGIREYVYLVGDEFSSLGSVDEIRSVMRSSLESESDNDRALAISALLATSENNPVVIAKIKGIVAPYINPNPLALVAPDPNVERLIGALEFWHRRQGDKPAIFNYQAPRSSIQINSPAPISPIKFVMPKKACPGTPGSCSIKR